MLRSWTTGMTGLICLACCGCQSGGSGLPQFSTGGSAAISGSTTLGAVSRPQPVQVSQSVESPAKASAAVIKPGDTLRMRNATPLRLTPVTGEPPALLPVSTESRRRTVQTGSTRIPCDAPGSSPVRLAGQQQPAPVRVTRQRPAAQPNGSAITIEMIESNRPLATVVTPRKIRATAARPGAIQPNVRSGSWSQSGKNELQVIRENPMILRLPPVPVDGLSRNQRMPQEPIPVYPEIRPRTTKPRKPSREDL